MLQDGATAVWERLVSAKDAELARLAEQHQAEVTRLVEQLAVKDEQLRQPNVIIAQLTQRPAELPPPVTSVDTAPPAPLVDTPAPVNQSPAEVSPAPAAPVRRPWWAFWRS